MRTARLFVAVLLAATLANADPLIDRLTALAKLPPFAWRFHAADMPHGEAPLLDDSSWPETGKADWKGGTTWLRGMVEITPALAGSALRLEVHTSHQIIVYINGNRAAMGTDLEPTVITENARAGDRFLIAVKLFAEPGPHTWRYTIHVEPPPDRPNPLTLAQEIQSVEILGGNVESARAALATIDDKSMRDAHARLMPLRDQFQKWSIRATGNSHIDMAWLWPWSETVDVVKRTSETALQLMDEYPDYTFSQSSARAYAWLEEKYPDVFAQIQKRVAEGRWEIVGGMWVEPDLNMPDGESIVRQLLVGKRYFKEKFNKDVRIGWNPDSFGYNWQLPQIYKKSGVDAFVTQKLGWNDTTKIPHKLFWWQSPDGTRLLTYLPHDYTNSLDPVQMAKDTADYMPTHPGFTELMHLYGVGDHGGGPTRVQLDRGRKWSGSDVAFPRVFFGNAQGFFDDIAKANPTLPVWNDELYLEYHRGVFTSQAATKRNNRRSEALLLDAEKFAAFAGIDSTRPLDDAWKKVLFNQFHDVAAGSGIAAIYRDADRDYEEVRHAGEELRTRALDDIAASVDTRGAGIPLIVFNPLSWTRTGVVEAIVPFEPRGPKVQILEKLSGDRYRVLILAENIPPLGYKIFRIRHPERSEGPLRRHSRAEEVLRSAQDDVSLENEYLRITIDEKTGCITSLFDKRANREAIAPNTCGNLLQAFQDKPKDWDAWNIDANFEDKEWDLTEAEEVRVVERGPVRSIVRVVRKFQSSTFAQDYTLYAGVPRLDVVTDVDWREKHILIKAGVTVPVETTKATYEIPFGTIERPTTRNTPAEKAKFEVPALRWADLGDATFGVSILNDSKYGYDAKGSVLRLSLLRAPEWPDPHADEGAHHFTYSIYPHKGDWRDGETMRRGYELNDPLIAMTVMPHAGTLPAEHSFLKVSPRNAIVSAVKSSGDGTLVRVYEFEGKSADVALTFPHAIARAAETDLMENETGALTATGNELRVAIKPYEIKTLKVWSAAAGPPLSDRESKAVAAPPHS